VDEVHIVSTVVPARPHADHAQMAFGWFSWPVVAWRYFDVASWATSVSIYHAKLVRKTAAIIR